MRRTFIIFSLVTLTACGLDSFSASNASLIQSGLWPNPKKIPVCFVSGGEKDRSTIRKIVESEYEGRVGLGFSGWDSCSTDEMTKEIIRVAVVGGSAGVSMVGKSRRGLSSGGRETMRVGNSSFAIEHLALHEFAHAVGMEHEHKRLGLSDNINRNDCQKAEENVSKNFGGSKRGKITSAEYDPDSITNYCTRYDGNYRSKISNPKLSDIDIKTLKKAYKIDSSSKSNDNKSDNNEKKSEKSASSPVEQEDYRSSLDEFVDVWSTMGIGN